MHDHCVFHLVVIWTFRRISYLLNNSLSLGQKVCLNHFLLRSHKDFPHTLFSVLSNLLIFLCCSSLEWSLFLLLWFLWLNLSCGRFSFMFCSRVFGRCLNVSCEIDQSNEIYQYLAIYRKPMIQSQYFKVHKNIFCINFLIVCFQNIPPFLVIFQCKF